jgi:hypothetical protein
LEEWTGSVDTLANGGVRVSNPAHGLWREGSGWRLVPELELGEGDGPEAFIFGAITGLEAGADGRIYVLDREANQLRIFTGTGSHVRTVGRAGGGPGEYRNANGLVWLVHDTLMVVDQRGERYSILDREGKFGRAVPRNLHFYGWTFTGGATGGKLYEQASAGNGPDRRVVLIGTSPASHDTTFVRDTVWLPAPQGPLFQGFTVSSDQGSMTMPVPFTSRPVYRLDPAGNVWSGHGSAFRLLRTTLAGDTTMEIVLEATPRPVTEAELAEWEQDERVKEFRARGGQIDPDRIPKTKPFFDGLHFDPDGFLWASLPGAPGEATFAVFDSTGLYLGRVVAMGVHRNTNVPPVVRNGRLYLAGHDDQDVPKVFVFRIDMRPK